MQYIGAYTEIQLEEVACGRETLEMLRESKRRFEQRIQDDPTQFTSPDLAFSTLETLSILEKLEDREPRELVARLFEHQRALFHIDQYPLLYSTEYLTPDLCREWHKAQIERMRSLLKK
jgi:hypothetical protein